MQITFRTTELILFPFFLLALLCAAVLPVLFDFKEVLVLYALNGGLSFYFLVHTLGKQKISLLFIYSLFNLVFFSLAPAAQYLTNFYLYTANINEYYSYFQKAGWLILSTNILFFLSYYHFFEKWQLKLEYSPQPFLLHHRKLILLLLLGIGLAIGAYVTIKAGYEVFLFRYAKKRLFGIFPKAIFLLYANFFMPTTLFAFIIYAITNYTKRYSFYLLTFMLALMAMIYNFPVSAARYYALTIILVLYVSFFMKKTGKGYLFLFLIPLGVVGIRAMSFFRHSNTLGYLQREGLGAVKLFELSMDYDAHEMFTLALRYVDEFGYQWGENLLGAGLFFFPRALWPSKPIDSGTMITTELFSDEYWTQVLGFPSHFHNVSQPLIGELYLSFGIIGVAAGFFILGALLAIVDTNFQYIKHKNTIDKKLYPIIYAAWIGLLFFLLRGTILSAFAYLVGITISYVISLKINGINLTPSIVRYRRTQ